MKYLRGKMLSLAIEDKIRGAELRKIIPHIIELIMTPIPNKIGVGQAIVCAKA